MGCLGIGGFEGVFVGEMRMRMRTGSVMLVVAWEWVICVLLLSRRSSMTSGSASLAWAVGWGPTVGMGRSWRGTPHKESACLHDLVQHREFRQHSLLTTQSQVDLTA